MKFHSRRIALTAAAAALSLSAAAVACTPTSIEYRTAIDDGLKKQELVLHLALHDKIYFKGPPLLNMSKTPITIRKISLGDADPEIQFVDMRSYKIKDFGEGPPAMWSSSNKKGPEAIWDPGNKPSTSVVGRLIEPGKPLISPRREWIMVELEAQNVGTFRTHNIVIEYAQAGKMYQQKLSAGYVLVVARNEADRQKLISYWLTTGKIGVAK